MFVSLLLLFTLVPIIELTLLIRVGKYLGPLPTLGLVALTGVVGVSLARSQGFLVVNRIRDSLSAGKLPADSLIEGLLILIGGVMLLTPGLLTDVTGFSLVIPGTRGPIRQLVKRKFKKQIDSGNLKFSFFGNYQPGQKEDEQEESKNHDNQSWEEAQKQEDNWEDLSDSIEVDYEEVDEDE